MPYNEFNSNRFKLLTDTALLFTLVFSVLLKVDLTKEDIDKFQVGILMLVSNTILPAGGLALAMLHSFVTKGVEELTQLKDEDKGKRETEYDDWAAYDKSDFVNPMSESFDTETDVGGRNAT
jgi:hypothetical protein